MRAHRNAVSGLHAVGWPGRGPPAPGARLRRRIDASLYRYQRGLPFSMRREYLRSRAVPPRDPHAATPCCVASGSASQHAFTILNGHTCAPAMPLRTHRGHRERRDLARRAACRTSTRHGDAATAWRILGVTKARWSSRGGSPPSGSTGPSFRHAFAAIGVHRPRTRFSDAG